MFCTHWERLSLTYCTGVLCSLFSNSGILLEKYGWLMFLLLIILWQPSVWAWARPTPGSEALRRHHNGEPTLQLQERPPWTGLTTGTPIPVYKPLTPSITSCNGCAATRFGWISTTTRPVSRSTQLKYFCNDPRPLSIRFPSPILWGGRFLINCHSPLWSSCAQLKHSRLGVLFLWPDVTQELPAFSTLNTSMYAVQAGFQDYFHPLFYGTATASQLIGQVESVVSAIGDFIQVFKLIKAVPFPCTKFVCCITKLGFLSLCVLVVHSTSIFLEPD